MDYYYDEIEEDFYQFIKENGYDYKLLTEYILPAVIGKCDKENYEFYDTDGNQITFEQYVECCKTNTEKFSKAFIDAKSKGYSGKELIEYIGVE